MLVEINECPICSYKDSEIVYRVRNERGNFYIKRCSNCSLCYTNSDSDADTSELYDDDVYHVVDNRKSVYTKIINHEYRNVLDKVSTWCSEGSSLLDFGSGKGIFLNLAGQAGYKALGVETAINRAEFAEKMYHAEVLKSDYSGGKIASKPFDIITLFHVLEHLPEPERLLKELIGYNLNESGILILEVPNLSSLQSSIAKSRWMHLDVPRHLLHFTSKRLLQLVDELDLKVKKVEYFSWHLGVLGMCQSILTLFGFKKKIIKELKQYNIKLLSALIIIFPAALLLEVIAATFKRGGIVRVYCQNS